MFKVQNCGLKWRVCHSTLKIELAAASIGSLCLSNSSHCDLSWTIHMLFQGTLGNLVVGIKNELPEQVVEAGIITTFNRYLDKYMDRKGRIGRHGYVGLKGLL